jgi:hypothetical protein
MNESLDGERFSGMNGHAVQAVDAIDYETPTNEVGTRIQLNDKTIISLRYWRLVKPDETRYSIFDHKEKYGQANAFDSIGQLKKDLLGQTIDQVLLDTTTGDLLFRFKQGLRLEVFNFTAFEIWDIQFPDGTQEFSNHL